MVKDSRYGVDAQEIRIMHSGHYDLLDSTMRVFDHLLASDFNCVEFRRMLKNLPNSNPDPDVWDRFSMFWVSCDEIMFKKIFEILKPDKLDLGRTLEMLGSNNSTGEDIYAFIINMANPQGPLRGRTKVIKDLNEKVKKIMKSEPNINLIKIGKLYNELHGNDGNNFMTFDYWKSVFTE